MTTQTLSTPESSRMNSACANESLDKTSAAGLTGPKLQSILIKLVFCMVVLDVAFLKISAAHFDLGKANMN